MSHPNETIVRNAYDAIAQGNVQPLTDMLAADTVWHVSGRSPLAGDYRGPNEILTFFSGMMDLYDGTLRVDVRDVIANDNHAVVLTNERATHNGTPLEWTGAHLWTFTNGRCTQFVNYTDDAYDNYWS